MPISCPLSRKKYVRKSVTKWQKSRLISVMAIKERMEEVFGRGFDYTYIRKLVGKVRNEIVLEIDRAQIEPRLHPRKLPHDARGIAQDCLLDAGEP
jgi:hypothetical protein